MATNSSSDAEDVESFLRRIEELRSKSNEEDDERNRKLEEEIARGKLERKARRQERSRSISPIKSSPANSPDPSRYNQSQESDLPVITTTTTSPRQRTSSDALEDPSCPQSKKPTLNRSTRPGDTFETVSMEPRESNPAPTRELSWQQRRPKSQASDRPISRPLSRIAAENASQSSLPSLSSDDMAMPRDQIARSLASKDPSFFRQTADRGASSAAYRKTQVEEAELADHTIGGQLPGMSRPEAKNMMGETSRDVSPKRTSASRPGRSKTLSSVMNSESTTGRRSPMPMSPAQRFDPPGSDTTSSNERVEHGITRERVLAMSPAQGRISPERAERPQSPTKGMGGFVQSAMMKRSDSVSKRWSVQSPAGLNRSESIASNRKSMSASPGPGGFGELLKSPPLREPNSMSNGPSRSTSRPSSSYGSSSGTVIRDVDRASTPSRTSTPASDAVKSGVASRVVAGELGMGELLKKNEENKPKESEVPVSQSKTMDPRRWSPTKASWLESALNKPEVSPKPKPPATPSQPAWMAEIAKAKQKAPDLNPPKNATPKHEVKVGGLMRSPAMGVTTKPPSLGGLPSNFGASSMRGPEAVGKGALNSNRTGGGGSIGQIDGRYSPRPTSSSQSPERPDSSSSNQSAPKTPVMHSPELGKSPSPAAISNKPDVPLKKDFRSSLKARQPPPSSSDNKEPEFKSVFGQLRRTKTENYVAPDELKDNILRGKSALNATGGPKKTERVDEFKNAILKKKKDFEKVQSEGKGVTRSASASKEETVPEAIARRKSLAPEKEKSGPPVTPPKPTQIGIPDKATPEALTKARALRGDELKPKPTLPQKETTAPGRLPAAGGKLADRFNPALAGLLARGPPGTSNEAPRGSSASSHRSTSMGTSGDATVEKPGPKLEHMTKGRARGPRRKAPTSVKKSDDSEKSQAVAGKEPELQKPASPELPEPTKEETPSAVSTKVEEKAEEKESSTSQPGSPRKRTMTLNRRSRFLEELASKNEKPPEPTRPKSPVKKLNLDNIFQAPPSSSKEAQKPAVGKLSREFLPKSPPKTFGLEKKVESTPEVKNNSVSTTSTPTTTKERPVAPPKSPVLTRNALGDTAKINIKPEPVTVKQDLESKPVTSSTMPPPPPPQKEPDTAPKPESTRPMPAPINVNVASVSHQTQSASPTKKNSALTPQSTEASRLFREFFGEPTSPPPEYKIDTASILMNKPSSQAPKLTTISCQLFQLSANGKKIPVHQSQARTLFEENMYLCEHTFNLASSNAKVVEVYFWIGDEVPDSVVQDAEIFASREAKAAGGKLIFLYQGRESAIFFQALGGIVITRRGTSTKYDSLAPYILCARQCQGSIAFDEVDFAPTSLCSGFPYVINSKGANMWLWKGKGSTANEIESAREVGLELGIMGSIEEVEEGNEPDEFLSVFAIGQERVRIRGGAGHWKLKAKYPGYCGRLFKVEVSKVTEISPFTQTSISPHHIFVLDAFFEIYIIVGAYSGAVYPGASVTAYGGAAALPESSPGSKNSHPLSKPPSQALESPSSPEAFLPTSPTSPTSPPVSPDSVRSMRSQPPSSPYSPTSALFYIKSKLFKKKELTSRFSTDQNKGNQFDALHTALQFAQEYGILAAGAEDRPFVPVSTVVVEGMPKDARVVVRKWKDGVVTTKTNPNINNTEADNKENAEEKGLLGAGAGVPGGGLRRGRSLRVVTLMAALDAVRH